MRVRDVLARLTAHPQGDQASHPPEAFTVMHSADLDVHLAGVVGTAKGKPPWPTSTWVRHGTARHREPSELARVLLDLHPAFAECLSDHAHWMQIEQAEQLAMEWVAAWFTPAEATDWLGAYPELTALQARDLANAGWKPRDVHLGGKPDVWVEQAS